MPTRVPPRHHVLVLGRPLRAGAVGEMARRIAELGGNIDSIVRLTQRPVTALELVVSGADPRRLGVGLVAGAAAAGVDVAVERAGLQRRAKRLLLLDLDAAVAGADQLAALADVVGPRCRVAPAAGRGRRPAHRRGGPGPRRAARRRTGSAAWTPCRGGCSGRTGRGRCSAPSAAPATACGVVTGGVAQLAERLVDGLGLDFLAANRLEVADGRLTGRIVGEVVDRGGRARALVRFAECYGVPLSQTVGVGSGSGRGRADGPGRARASPWTRPGRRPRASRTRGGPPGRAAVRARDAYRRPGGGRPAPARGLAASLDR